MLVIEHNLHSNFVILLLPQMEQSKNQQSYGDDRVKGNSNELMQTFLEILEEEKEQLSKELKEKDKIIEAQQREL